MLRVRVIPSLLLKDEGLVKGSQFKRHRYVGDPINAVKIFNDKEVDELVFMDISATQQKRSPNFELIEDIASQAFMPFGYGGGLNTLGDVEKLFKIGVEKAIINSAAVNNLEFVKDASSIAGSQSIVVSIDVKKNFFGKYHVYSNSGSINTKLDPVDFALRAQDAGAGEIILCSIDREGAGNGFDLSIIETISDKLSIPLVAQGGAANLEHFKDAVGVGASAVAAGDMFVFHGKHKAVLITYPEYSELEAQFNEIVKDRSCS